MARRKALAPDTTKTEQRVSGSGILLFGGRHFQTEDYNPALHGQAGARIYEEMRRSDPEIAAGLARILWPLLAAKWTVERVDDSDQAEEIGAFLDKWVLGEGRTDFMAPKWTDVLRHALLCLSDGFSAFEKVWGYDEESGRQVIARLEGILPKSVHEFRFDSRGDLEYLEQRAWTNSGYKTAQLPVAKLVLVTFGREANNLWGWPILRPCYKPWYWKDKLWRIDGMRHERHGLGFTTLKVPDGLTAEERDAAEAMVREARANERSYAVIGSDYELSIDYPTGQGTDVVSSIKYLDTQIAQALWSEAMHLGTSQSGSRAVAESKVDVFLAALQSVGNLVEEAFNSQVIPELVASNWGPQEQYPRLQCEDLSKLSGKEMADTIAALLNATAIKPRADLEQALLESYDLPKLSDEELDQRKEQESLQLKASMELLKNPQPLPAPGGAPPPGGAKPPAAMPKEPKPDATASERVQHRRELLPHEAFCAFAEMGKYLDDEPKRIWTRVVAPVRESLLRKIAKEVSEMTDAELRGKALPRPGITQLTSDLYPALLKVYRQGRRAVLEERDRQRGMTPVEPLRMAEIDDDEEDTDPTAKQEAWVRSLAGKFAGLLTLAMATEAVRVAWNSRNADLTKEAERQAIENAVRELSVPRQQVALGGVVTQAFTNGRNEQAETMIEEVGTAYYSAVLDPNTCENCAPLDGEQHEPGDPAYATPNPNCLGGDNCRCVTVYVWQQEEA